MSRADESDPLGDLLRAFYAAYGVKDEGPPEGMNVTSAFQGLTSPEEDLALLRAALSDEAALRKFRQCRDIVDELASRLTGEELLKELVGVPLSTGDGVEQLSSGVLWFSMAASLDSRVAGHPVTPFDKQLEIPFPQKVQMTIQGSLVLRLYVALVYMREGVLNDLISTSARAGGQCSGRVKKLLNCDFVRHVRNSLSHGSFGMTVGGIGFRDETHFIIATPGFLSWLCTWLMLIQLQALTASTHKVHVA